MPLRSDLEFLSSGHVLVFPQGELDLAERGGLDDLLESVTQFSSLQVITDLSRVTFMDPSALTSMLRGHRMAEQLGGELVLTGASPRIVALLAMTQLDRALCVHPTSAAAIAATAASAEPRSRTMVGCEPGQSD